MEFSASSPINSSLPITTPTSADGINIRPVDQSTLPFLSTLNGLVLPVTYPKRFYTQLLSSKTAHSYLAFHPAAAFGRPVGGIVADSEIAIEGILQEYEAKTEGVDNKGDGNTSNTATGVDAKTAELIRAARTGGRIEWIYIQTLCVLAPFRRLGIAGSLIETLLQNVSEPVVGLWAHVHSGSEDAIEWYEKRGFVKLVLVEGYYRKLVPNSAWVMVRVVERTGGVPGESAVDANEIVR